MVADCNYHVSYVDGRQDGKHYAISHQTDNLTKKTAFHYVWSGNSEQLHSSFIMWWEEKDISDSLFGGNVGTCWTRTMGIKAIGDRPLNTATNAGRLDCTGVLHLNNWEDACIMELGV
jgi:hypothetical protein